jgi:hypothetical protein
MASQRPAAWSALAIALALVAACSAAPTAPTPTGGEPTAGQPTDGTPTSGTSGPPATGVEPTGQPLGSPGPNDLPLLPPEDLNPPPDPLPEPELTDIFDIQSALTDPGYADQAVVSVLQVLGIGTYHDDGTPITPGTETSDADFFLSESEVRNLIEMLISGLTEDSWISFADFHEGIVGLGFDISAEDLASTYQQAYADNPDLAISQLVPYIGVDVPLPPFGAWLLFLDGFVPPNGSGPIASVGGTYLAPRGRGGLGTAWQQLHQRLTSPQAQNAFAVSAQNAHIIAMVGRATLSVDVLPYVAHEGHGGTGAPVTITTTLNATPPVSAFSGQPIIPGCPNALMAGVPINWQYSSQVTDHGTPRILNPTTDGGGKSKVEYTPKKEKANGHGYEVQVIGAITATAKRADIATKLYCASPALALMSGGTVTNSGNMLIKWHEPETIHIKATLTNYRASFIIGGAVGDGGAEMHGSDEFEGNLVQQEDGSWLGTVTAKAQGGWSGHSAIVLASQGRCSSTWNTSQQLEVRSKTTLANEIVLLFYPRTSPRPSVTGKCAFTRTVNGFAYIPLGDQALTQPDGGQGLEIHLPSKPGGTQDYPFRVNTPGGGIAASGKWTVEITYLGPP